MPIGVTEKNINKVFSEHLQAGENATVVSLAGTRGILGITDQNKVIHCNFPLFGKSKIIESFVISDIVTCEYNQKNDHAMVLILDVNGKKKKYQSNITPFIDSKELVSKFAAIVIEKNGNARPSYLGADEEIVDHISTKKNNYTLTSKHLFCFSKDSELKNKTPLTNYSLFDFYPGKMDSTFLYFETTSGSKELLNIATSSTSLVNFFGSDPTNLINSIYSLLNHKSIPNYLNNEQLVTTLRASTSLLGTVNPSHILKLTTERLIDLSIDKNGALEFISDIDLRKITKLKVTKISGQQGAAEIYQLKFTLVDKTKKKYMLSSVYSDAIKLLEEQISKV